MTAKNATPATPVETLTRDDAVVKCLIAANKAGKTMLDQTREAAKKAAAQLDPAKPLKDRLAAVMSAYSAELSQNHNVKAIFSDSLTLLACGQTDVAVKVTGKDGKATDDYVKAAQAVDMSKHNLRDAAKQVREAHGMARAKAANPKAKAAAPAAVTKGEVDKFSAWLDDMPAYLGDAVYHPRLVAALIEAGWTLTKATKGVKINGKAAA